jgi:hypothetical protein
MTTINTPLCDPVFQDILEHTSRLDNKNAGLGQGRAIPPPKTLGEAIHQITGVNINDFSNGIIKCDNLMQFIDLAHRQDWPAANIVSQIQHAVHGHHGIELSDLAVILLDGLHHRHICQCARQNPVMFDHGA